MRERELAGTVPNGAYVSAAASGTERHCAGYVPAAECLAA